MNTGTSDTSQLDRLIESFMERRRRGELPSIEEFARLNPELADQIREVFPALAALEEVAGSAGPNTASLPTPEREWMAVPERLGEYRILREIGRGGMGVVCEAEQASLGRHVALKVLPPHLAQNAVYLERFRREAKAAAQLHHTSIVPVYGVGEHDGICYYAMQYLRGQTIEAVLRELRCFQDGDPGSSSAPTETLAPARDEDVDRDASTGRSVVSNPSGGSSLSVRSSDGELLRSSSTFGQSAYFRNVAEVGVQVAEALAYAHGQGVVHRDIKPSNLMLDLNGTVWVTDFGLAKVEGSGDLTNPGDVLGTLRYMAPEQLAGSTDARSDIYSLGVTLYELATLRLAFADPVRARLVDHIRYEEPPSPRRVEPNVPRDLERIIQKAIAKEPGRRYASAGELAADLRRFLLDRPVLARPAGPIERAWRWAGRRRKFIVTAVCAAVIAVGLLFGLTVLRDANRRDAARVRTESFMTALESRDHRTLQTSLTEAGRRNYGEGMFARLIPGDGEPAGTFRIEQMQVDRDTARANVTVVRGQAETAFELNLVREGGVWGIERVRARNEAFAISIHPPSFAGPPPLFRQPEPEVREEPALVAYSPEQFDALWRIDLDSTDEPAGPLLERLAKELKLSFAQTDGQQSQLARRVTISKKGSSRLEAIEEICRRIDMHPVYEGSQFRLKPGPRPLPVEFSGPLCIEVSEVAQFPPHATGYVLLTVRGYGLPPNLDSRFERRIELAPLRDSKGNTLDDTLGLYDSGGYAIEPNMVYFRQIVPLKNLLRSVETVSIDGHLSLSLPTNVATLRFDPLTANATRRAGKVAITLRAFGDSEPCATQWLLKGANTRDARITGFDSAGKPIVVNSDFSGGSDEYSEISKVFQNRPSSVEATVIAETRPIRFPVALPMIALPRRPEMPESLSPAKFPAATGAVSIESSTIVEKGNFGRIRWKLANHSDKPIRRIDLDVTYFDANSRQADDFPGPRLATIDSRAINGLLKPGDPVEVTAPAFGLPANATRVDAKVRRIEFADATSWQP